MRDHRVLITGAGGPAAVGVIRALAGTGARLYAADIDPYAQGLYAVPADRRLIVPRGDAPEFAETLGALARHHGIDLLVPTVESELLPLVEIADDLGAAGISLLSARRPALETCLDKWATIEALAPASYLPRTEILDGGFDPASWQFPAFVKPRRASGSNGAATIPSAADLAGLPVDGSLMVQEMLPLSLIHI